MNRTVAITVSTLVSFAFFLCLLGPGLDWFDTPELVQAAFFLDLTHPPGQPLFVMLGKIATLIPVGSIPFRLSLLSALTVSVAIGMVVAMLSRRSVLALAILISGVLALNPTLVLQAVRAEVYGLHLAWAMMVVVLSFCSTLHWRRLYAVLFLFGLGLGNHHFLMLLLTPMLAAAWWFGLRGQHLTLRHLSNGLMALFAGLAIYLLVAIRSAAHHPTIFGWGEADSLSGLLQFLRGRDFAVYFLWPWQHPELLYKALAVLGFFTVASLLVSIPWVVRRRPPQLILLWLGAICCFFAYTIKVFYPQNPDALGYLAIVVLLIWASIGLYLQELPRVYGIFILAISLLFTGIEFNRSPHPLNRSRHKLVESYALELEHHAALGSIAILSSDHALFPLQYRQNVERQRPDLVYYSPNMSRARWYRDYLEQRYAPLKVSKQRGELAGYLLRDNPKRPWIAEFSSYLHGMAVQPWRLWYARPLDGVAKPGTQREESLFLQEYAVSPQRYRMSGGQIRSLILAGQAKHWRERQAFERSIQLQSQASEMEFWPMPRIGPAQCRFTEAQLPLPVRLSPFTPFISDRQEELLRLTHYLLDCQLHEEAERVAAALTRMGNPSGVIMLVARQLPQTEPATPEQRSQADASYSAALTKLLPLSQQFGAEPSLWCAMGILAMKLGQWQQAEQWFKVALRLDGNFNSARRYLEHLQARQP